MRASGFTTLVTVDRNLAYQQHIAASGLAVIVMHAVTNRLPQLVPLAPQVLEAIATTGSGEIMRVGVSRALKLTGDLLKLATLAFYLIRPLLN